MNRPEQYSEVWWRTVEKFGELFGSPLPREVLRIGNPRRGWEAVLDNSDAEIGGASRFEVVLNWGGFPAGIIGPRDGVIAAGSAANEDSYLEWIDSQEIAESG